MLGCGKPAVSKAVHGLPTEPGQSLPSQPASISCCHHPERLSQDSASPSRAPIAPNTFIQSVPIPAVLQVWFPSWVGAQPIPFPTPTSVCRVCFPLTPRQGILQMSPVYTEIMPTLAFSPCVHSIGNANQDGEIKMF